MNLKRPNLMPTIKVIKSFLNNVNSICWEVKDSLLINQIHMLSEQVKDKSSNSLIKIYTIISIKWEITFKAYKKIKIMDSFMLIGLNKLNLIINVIYLMAS